MKYYKKKNEIIIDGKEDFNPKHILECGQIFRFEKNVVGNYVVYSKDYAAEIEDTKSGYIIKTDAVDYFENFFNLKVDYGMIKNEISKLSPIIEDAVNNASGLRILKGDLFEVLVSFIISANNNIKRIKLIINKICERLGEWKGEYFAFPTPEAFGGVDEEFFKSIGAGYRAPYLAEVKTAYNLLIKEDLDAMTDIELRKRLMEIKGVGPKVADCIMLFAFNRKRVFPVDVWMERVYYEYFGKKKFTRLQIAEYLKDMFHDNAGYVQQYLFYSKTVKNEN